MEKDITAYRVANAIKMDTSFKGFHLIVEGYKDVKLFGKYIDKTNVRINVAFGFENAILVLKDLDAENFTNRIAVLDSDFNKITGITYDIDGLFFTDYHDIEVMILLSKALEDILYFYCSEDRVKSLEGSKNKTVREILFELGAEIGYLKLANKLYNLGLIFKPSDSNGNQVKYREFIDENTLDYKGKAKMIETLVNYSRNKTSNLKSVELINEKFTLVSSEKYEITHLVNGHDLANILFLILKKTLKSSNNMLTDYNSIESSLVLAYDYEDFKKTNLYNHIQNHVIAKGASIFK